MVEEREHIIHLVNGKLAPDSTTSQDDIRRIVAQSLAQNRPSGIVVHFHGGLTSQSSAREIARDRLYPLYAEGSQAYPIFFVWESGFYEVVRNNLQSILHEGLFREAFKIASEWLLKSLPEGFGLKGAGGAAFNESQFREDLDDWFDGRRDSLPEPLDSPAGLVPGSIDARTRGLATDLAIDTESLVENISETIEGSTAFQREVEAVCAGLLPAGQERPAARGSGTQVAENSLISKQASERLFEQSQGTAKGLGPISWYKVAKSIASIVVRGVLRFRHGRDHGKYLTVVEETLRELYVDKLGRKVWWDAMKNATAAAFQDGTEYGGTAFLYELQTQLKAVGKPPKITLIGDSAGTVYVCNFLAAAHHWLPQMQFDVIFEAPAVSHKILADIVRQHGGQISHFRQFGMTDALERGDTLMPIIYIGSMLYFVSGLLEDTTDEPLAGMERYLAGLETYSAEDFPDIATCRQFYARFPHGLIWSPSSAGNGRNSQARRHGDFDHGDAPTMDSVQHILQHGY
jgi:hypothetical protein